VCLHASSRCDCRGRLNRRKVNPLRAL
jgi:hypothetical protein